MRCGEDAAQTKTPDQGLMKRAGFTSLTAASDCADMTLRLTFYLKGRLPPSQLS